MANYLATIIIFYTVLYIVLTVYAGSTGTLDIPSFQDALDSSSGDVTFWDVIGLTNPGEPGITDYIVASFTYAYELLIFLFRIIFLDFEGIPLYLKGIVLTPLTIIASYEIFARLFRGSGS